MEVKSVKKLVGTIYFLIDDSHKPIMPVYRFMLNMISNGLEVEVCMCRTAPEKYIRNIRSIEKLKNQIGDSE